MSDDLTKRLRAVVPYQGKSSVAFLCHEAADRIEALEDHPNAQDYRNRGERDAAYWRDLCEDLVFSTGTDLDRARIAAMAELARHPKTMGPIITGINEMGLRRRLQRFTKALGVETVPHGLRKNAVNVLLEAGCTVPEVAAITGQTHAIVEKYAAKVNRRKLGQSAIVKLEAHRNKSA